MQKRKQQKIRVHCLKSIFNLPFSRYSNILSLVSSQSMQLKLFLRSNRFEQSKHKKILSHRIEKNKEKKNNKP